MLSIIGVHACVKFTFCKLIMTILNLPYYYYKVSQCRRIPRTSTSHWWLPSTRGISPAAASSSRGVWATSPRWGIRTASPSAGISTAPSKLVLFLLMSKFIPTVCVCLLWCILHHIGSWLLQSIVVVAIIISVCYFYTNM